MVTKLFNLLRPANRHSLPAAAPPADTLPVAYFVIEGSKGQYNARIIWHTGKELDEAVLRHIGPGPSSYYAVVTQDPNIVYFLEAGEAVPDAFFKHIGLDIEALRETAMQGASRQLQIHPDCPMVYNRMTVGPYAVQALASSELILETLA